jgi:hypothetical protein
MTTIQKITVNGNDFTQFIENSDFAIRYALDEKTGSIPLGTTNEITFTGDAFDWIEGFFFGEPENQYTNVADVSITVDCCGTRTYDFVMDAEGIIYCPDTSGNGCSARATLRTNDNEDICYRSLASKIFWKDNGFNNQINNTQYFAKLGVLQAMDIWNWVLLYLWLIVKSIPIISIIQIIDNIFGSGNNVFNRIEDWIVGAGKFQMAFNVRRAIEYNIERCGLTFTSPTLQSEPHSRLYWLEAQYDNGIDQRFQNNNQRVLELWEKNAPNRTTIDLLTNLKPVFDHEFRLIKTQVVFDKRSNLINYYPELFDLEKQLKADGTDVCYKYRQLEAYAYGRFEYKNDSVETIGNQAGIPLYNDIVDWNTNPVNRFQRDELTNSIDFAPVRFQNDTLTTKYDIEDIAFFVEFNRRSGLWGRVHNNEVFLSGGFAFLPKLIHLGNDMKPARRQVGTAPGPFGAFPLFEYNELMRFKEDGDPNNLYNRFHKDRNPRLRTSELLEIEGLEISLNCEILNLLEEWRVNLHIATPYGKGTFDEVEIDFTRGVIKFGTITI